jgi:CelD/BcsL family acetyltransferase involved in cellulose biosynthesis
VIEVSIAADPAPLVAEWEALAQRLRTSPFLSPDWIAAHRSAFGTGRLMLIVVRRDGALAVVLPLARRGRHTARSVTNAHSPQFGVLSEERSLTMHALRAVADLGVSRLALSYVDSGDPLAFAVRDHARAAGRRLAERVMLRSPYIELAGTHADYRARLKRSFKADLRRRNRRLAESGEARLDIEDGSYALDALLAECWRLERGGWKSAGGTAVADHPATERFYREVAHRAAARDRLHLSFLRLNGRAIAFTFGLQQNGVLYLLKGGFDAAYSRFSPGQLLQERLIEHAYGTGLSRIELLGNDEPYKLHWTDKVHERLSQQCFAPSYARRAQWAIYAHGRPLALRMGVDRVARPLRDRARIAIHAARSRPRDSRRRAGSSKGCP